MQLQEYLKGILFFIALVLPLNSANAQAHTKADCDRLIKSGIEALHKNQHTHSLELLFEANSLAKKNGWNAQEFLALNNIGTNYYRLFEYGEALNYFLEASNIAVKKLTSNEELKVLNNIAILYLEEKKYAQANDYFKKVYVTAKDNKEYLMAGIAAINLGTLAVETNDLELGKSYYNQALPLIAKKPEYIVLAKGGLANCYLLQGNTALARQSAEYLLANTADLEFYHTEVELLLIISKSYLKENKLDMASEYLKRIFDKKPNLETKIKLFKLLTEIYTKKAAYHLALQYKDSLFDATAKLNESKNEKLYENGKVKFELQNYKNQSILNESKLVGERKIFYYVLSFVVIIVLLSLWAVRNLSLKLRQEKLITDRNEQILALEQERLKNEVELKNRKLSAKALYLSGRNEMIEEILSELSVIPQVSNDNPLLAHIKSLKNQLKSDKEWDHFITHFEEVNQGFLNALKLKYPTLTVNDIRYISYIYMNLSVKEIASMLNITQETCRKRKERILAKMELSKDTNLYTYLTSL